MNSLRVLVIIMISAVLAACSFDSTTVLWGDDANVSPFPLLETADVVEVVIDDPKVKDRFFLAKWRDQDGAAIYLVLDDPKNREKVISDVENQTGLTAGLWMEKINDAQYIVRAANYKDDVLKASRLIFLNYINGRWIGTNDIADDVVFSKAITSGEVSENPFEQIQPSNVADIRGRLTAKNVLAISNFIQSNLDKLAYNKDYGVIQEFRPVN